jgi:hypothetical protein
MTQTGGYQHRRVMRESSRLADEIKWLIPNFQEKPLAGCTGVRTEI